MGSGQIARFLLAKPVSQKTAGIIAGAVRKAGGMVGRAAQNDPGTVALGVAGTAAFAPLMLQGDPANKQRKAQKAMQQKHMAARAGGYMKRASVLFSEEEVQRAVSIRRSLEKVAARAPSVSQVLSKNLPGLYAAGALLGAGAGTAGAVGGTASFGVGKVTEGVRSRSRGRRYNAMVKADPSLKREGMARVYFNVLDKASPYIASEPHVAAATVRSMMEAPEGYALHPKYMKDILGVEESRQKTRFPTLRGPTFKADMPGME